MKGPIQSAEVSYLVHATEDPDRIGFAVTALIGSVGEPMVDKMEGHFGNAIMRVSFHPVGAEAQSSFSRLVSKMGPALKRRLREELGAHMDEHSALYLRLDKQKLMAGRLELGDADPIRLRVKLRLHTVKGGAASLFAGLLA